MFDFDKDQSNPILFKATAHQVVLLALSGTVSYHEAQEELIRRMLRRKETGKPPNPDCETALSNLSNWFEKVEITPGITIHLPKGD